MSSRKLLVILFAMAFVAVSMSTAHAQPQYLTALSAACSGTSCTSCHPAGGPPPFTSYGSSFSGISSHSSNPAGAIATLGCPGGTTACTGYTYSAWSPATCPASGQQTRTATNAPAGCTGTPPTAAVLTQSCTPPTVACTGYTYSAWSPATCPASGQQTRTATNAPAGCTGTPPTAAVLTQSCTPPTVACTGYTYSAWSPATCPASGQQTRTATNAPAGCTGTPPTAAVLTQSCTPSTVACTGYTYSAWSPSVCPASGQQTRTAANAPAGCTGTPPTTAVLTQVCNYVPPVTPPPTNGTMPAPTSKKVFSYSAIDQPVVSSDPAKAEPIGVGPVAGGGDTIDVNVQVGPFAGPVNVSLVIYAPTLESDELYFMSSNNGLKKLSAAVNEDQQSNISGQRSDDSGEHDSGGSSQPSSQFDRLTTWRNNVTGVNENIFTAPVSDLPSGVYTLVLVVKSGDNHYYRWVTHVTIPQSSGSHED